MVEIYIFSGLYVLACIGKHWWYVKQWIRAMKDDKKEEKA